MAVIDGVFVPNVPLATAEQHVDFVQLHREIIDRRAATERYAAPVVKRIAASIADFDLSPVKLVEDLALRLERSLWQTVKLGYREARREITDLRADKAARAATYSVPDAGRYAHLAAQGLDAIRFLMRERARRGANATAAAMHEMLAETLEQDPILRVAVASAAGSKKLHLYVLELVGEALNMGRTTGAMSMSEPPEFAMRSEQLDKRTCSICTSVHGEIVQVGSPEYFEILPPNLCLGGGRCRGLMIYGDDREAVSVPKAA